MRVSIAKGEKLEINITEGDRIIGALSISLNSIESAGRSAAAPSGAEPKRRGRKPGSGAVAKVAGPKKARNYTPEAKAKMKAAQQRRWEAFRAAKAQSSGDSSEK